MKSDESYRPTDAGKTAGRRWRPRLIKTGLPAKLALIHPSYLLSNPSTGLDPPSSQAQCALCSVRTTALSVRPAMPHPVPDIPGELLTDRNIAGHLSTKVAELCGLRNSKFPGAQPVSFTVQSLEMLETMDFWVCEKSDGVRVLVFIVMNGMTNNQEVWLVSSGNMCGHGLMQIDRKQRYFFIENLHFPHWEKEDHPLTDTILDGELVIDVDPKTGIVSRITRLTPYETDGRNVCVSTLSIYWC